MKKQGLAIGLVLVVSLVLVLLGTGALAYTSTDSLPVGSTVTLKTETGSTTQTYQLYPTIMFNSSTWQYELSGSPVTVNYSNSASYTGWFYKSGSAIYKFNSSSSSTVNRFVTSGFSGYYYIGRFEYESTWEYRSAHTFSLYDPNDHNNQSTVSEKLNAGSYTIPAIAGKVCNVYPNTTLNEGFHVLLSGEVSVYVPDNWYVAPGINGGYAKACGTRGDWVATTTYTWKFSPVQISKVTFLSGNGAANRTQSVMNNTKAVQPTEPTKEFYTFKGWRKTT